MPAPVSGTEGYADEAEELFTRYESIPAADAHRAVLHLIPTAPSSILDIGSGTGRDAAWFAAMGHRVVAVEPTDAMRLPAMALHPSPRIEWLNDSLPDLALLLARGESFDLVMLTAVWMHLDAQQRRQGDAEPCVSAAGGRRDDHEDPARAGPGGTAYVRNPGGGDDPAGADAGPAARSQSAHGIQSGTQPHRRRHLDKPGVREKEGIRRLSRSTVFPTRLALRPGEDPGFR